MTNLEKKLRALALRTIASDRSLKADLCRVAKQTRTSTDAFIDGFTLYNSRMDLYGNALYASLAVRGALLIHNHVQGSYHVERQSHLLSMLSRCRAQSICDVGYGVPGHYVKQFVMESRIHCTLLEKHPSANTFSKELISCWGNNVSWKDFISLGVLDLDIEDVPTHHDTYIFFDSIEHTVDPDVRVRNLVANTAKDTQFIFSLPIGSKPKMRDDTEELHYIQWRSNKEARKWLTYHSLKIVEEHEAHPTSKDLFTYFLENTFHNLIVRCTKI